MPDLPGDDADRRWAAEQVSGLLAKARAEALEEAHRRLRTQLVEALMSAAAARGGEPQARAREEPPEGGHADGLGVWVYGVVHGDAPEPARRAGVDERHDVELIRHAGLAAVASAVPRDEFREDVLEERLEDLQYLEVLARAHERVLDDILGLGPVVPLRICTIYESPERVREMLERERRPLAEALHRLGGTAEWGVKAYLGAGDEAPAETAPPPGSASGVDYLARKRDRRDAAEAARRAADATVEQIHRRLSEHAVDAVLSPAQDPRLSGEAREMLLNAAYLVPKARTDEFQSLVGDLTRRHAPEGLMLELTGPWPAYHFAGSAAAV
jgi:Gas vesicle synthesis protein GvpL/GvpF